MKKISIKFVSILLTFFSLCSIALADDNNICDGHQFPLSQWDGIRGCYISNDRCLGHGVAHAADTNCDSLCNDTCAEIGTKQVWASHTSACYEPAEYCVGDQYTAKCSCYMAYDGN